MHKLQFIIWKFAGDDGTFSEYIQNSSYKDLLLDRFFTVSERLLKAWRAMKSKAEVKLDTRTEDDSDLTSCDQDDDDATVAVSNCAKHQRIVEWEEVDVILPAVSVPDSIPSLDSEQILCARMLELGTWLETIQLQVLIWTRHRLRWRRHMSLYLFQLFHLFQI